MASPNRKITDLPLADPSPDHRFVVATQNNNYQIPYSGVVGPLTEKVDELSGKLVETGQILENKIDIVSGIAMDNRAEFRSGFAALQQTNYFITEVKNNSGPILPVYYDYTPTPNKILSGVFVDYGDALEVTTRWDGSFSHYIGTGYIQRKQIPLTNIVELGDMTRRFEGKINGVNAGATDLNFPRTGILSGRHEVAWDADNGRDPYILISSGVVNVIEMGDGPTPINITIDDIEFATPKPGELLGNNALKNGDIINIFVDYDFNLYHHELQEPDLIEVIDYGLAEPIAADSYPFVDMGAGIYRATIPVTVSDRDGDLGVSLRTVSKLGVTGSNSTSDQNFAGPNATRLLDQLYPIIDIVDPIDYNGRTDGLREGESIQLVNSITNFNALNGDEVEYLSIPNNNTDILISDFSVYEDPKTISHSFGVYNDSPNVSITAQRFSNGATASSLGTVKIANGPSISRCTLLFPAVSSIAPDIPGTNSVKGGDIVHCLITLDTQGESIDSIEISVNDDGVSDGTQTLFTNSYTSDNTLVTSLGGDLYDVIVPIIVSSTRFGDQTVTLLAKNQHGTISDASTSLDDLASGGQASITLDQSRPSISIDSIVYPTKNIDGLPTTLQALALDDSATINISSNFGDSILYESLDSDLEILDPNLGFTTKSVKCINPDSYNVQSNNLRITYTKTSNGSVVIDEALINIASRPLEFSFQIPNGLISSDNGEVYPFFLNSSQRMLQAPVLNLDPNQDPVSNLVQKSSGPNESDNNYELIIKDQDLKGNFQFFVSGQNLAGLNTLDSTPSNYNVSGFTERIISVSPQSILQGLGYIGTTVTNPSNVEMENLSEAGAGANGGTDYYFKDSGFTIDPEVNITMDIDDGFTICSGDGLISTTGDHFFNLDFLSRAANADTSTPAKYRIREI